MPTFLSGHGELVDLAVLLVAHGQVVGLRALRLVVGHGHVHHGEVARVEPRHRLGLRLPTVMGELEDLLQRKEGHARFRDFRSNFKDFWDTYESIFNARLGRSAAASDDDVTRREDVDAVEREVDSGQQLGEAVRGHLRGQFVRYLTDKTPMHKKFEENRRGCK